MSEDLVGVSVKLEWSSQTVLKLIELFKNAQCLYNTKDKLYHNKHARAEALESIAKEIEDALPGITATEIRTKLNYLRSQYSREILRAAESKKSGIASEEVYVPSSYWFEHLHFIKDFVRVRKGKSNLSQTFNDIPLSEGDEHPSSWNESSIENDASMTEPEDSTPAKKKKANTTGSDEALKAATTFLMQMAAEQKPDKFTEGLTTFISSSLFEIKDKNLRDEVSSKVMLLLFDYMKKQRELESS